MDIWEWVEDLQAELHEQGQGHLAEALMELPVAATDDDPRADALAPELLAAAKTMNNEWLEVYTRHWHLQYLVSSHQKADALLGYAVEALEKAHREETRECPQAVCTTQDLSFVYETIDAVGYAPEREAVCRESLLRVTPEWNCYDCLSRELADAVADQGRVDEARDVIETSLREMTAVGETPSTAYPALRARAANLAGNYELALQLCQEAEGNPYEQDRHRVNRHLQQTTAHRNLGQLEEAVQMLPATEDVRGMRSILSNWAEELYALVRSGILENHAQIGAALQSLLDYSSSVGALRSVIVIGRIHGVLAAERNIGWVAEEAQKAMEAVVDQLPQDHGASAAIAEVERARAGLGTPELPCPADELVGRLGELEAAPELIISWLHQAIEELPDDVQLQLTLVEAYRASGNTEKLVAHVASLADHPLVLDTQFRLAVQSMVASKASPQEIAEVVRSIATSLIEHGGPAHEFAAHRMLAEHAWRTDDFDATIQAVQDALEVNPKDSQVRHLAGLASLRSGAFGEAAGHFATLNETEPGSCDWELMTAATCISDWETVRSAAARLELDLPPGSGPIDGEFGWCRAVLGPKDDRQLLMVQRTGPVTGRVVEVSHPNRPTQLFGTSVVFEPAALNIQDREDEGESWLPIFDSVLDIPGESYVAHVVDGAAPSSEQWAATLEKLRSLGWGAWAAEWPDYTVVDPQKDGAPLQGIYVFLAVPEALEASEIDQTLSAATADWNHPVTWPSLVDELSEERQQQQADIMERYGITE